MPNAEVSTSGNDATTSAVPTGQGMGKRTWFALALATILVAFGMVLGLQAQSALAEDGDGDGTGTGGSGSQSATSASGLVTTSKEVCDGRAASNLTYKDYRSGTSTYYSDAVSGLEYGIDGFATTESKYVDVDGKGQVYRGGNAKSATTSATLDNDMNDFMAVLPYATAYVDGLSFVNIGNPLSVVDINDDCEPFVGIDRDSYIAWVTAGRQGTFEDYCTNNSLNSTKQYTSRIEVNSTTSFKEYTTSDGKGTVDSTYSTRNSSGNRANVNCLTYVGGVPDTNERGITTVKRNDGKPIVTITHKGVVTFIDGSKGQCH